MRDEHIHDHECDIEDDHNIDLSNKQSVREMLLGSGYAEKAVEYFINQPYMGTLQSANQISELTGHCGDTMKVYLDIQNDVIQDARIQVLGCPGAVASAMVTMEMVKGMNIDQAMTIRDADVFKKLEALPDQKQHCIRLSVKTLQKALEEYRNGNGKGIN